MKVTVFGVSDDLIELDGDIHEEFAPTRHGATFLAFSDGTVLRIEYRDGGCWEVRRAAKGTATFDLQPHDNDEATYTDVATLAGELHWCVCGDRFEKPFSRITKSSTEKK